jgi:uncharacterized protein (DUF433 family)
MTVELSPFIVADKHTLAGKPRVKGTRISVVQVLGHLAAGMTIEEIIEQFPSLTRESILACIAYAGEVVEEESMFISAA